MKNSTGKTSELFSSLYLMQQGTREQSGKLRPVERELIHHAKRPRKSLPRLRIHLGDSEINFSPFPISLLRWSYQLLMVCDAADYSFPEIEIVYPFIIQAKVVKPDIAAEWKLCR